MGCALVLPQVSRLALVISDDPESTHSVAECAVRADLSSPAREFVEAMGQGDWADDPYFTSPPDGDQLHDMAKFLAEVEHIVKWGVPSRMSAINHLQHGVWEIKCGRHRLAYFDTPGDGTYLPKPPVEDGHRLPKHLQTEFWRYPSMDEVLRVTNGFSKTQQKAPPEQVALAVTIRDEDVQHDG
jgi:hypothetical protein